MEGGWVGAGRSGSGRKRATKALASQWLRLKRSKSTWKLGKTFRPSRGLSGQSSPLPCSLMRFTALGACWGRLRRKAEAQSDFSSGGARLKSCSATINMVTQSECARIALGGLASE